MVVVDVPNHAARGLPSSSARFTARESIPPLNLRGIALVATLFLAQVSTVPALPPTVRSTAYDGATGTGLTHSYQPWMNSTVARTVEAWVYRSDGNRCETILGADYTTNLWFGFCPRLRFYRSGGTSADADVDVPAGKWTHVAASYDGSRVRFYINGVLSGDKALANSGRGGNVPMTVGAARNWSGLTQYPLSGYLDEVRVWSRALSATEIQNGQYVTNPTATNGLVARFSSGGSREDLAGAALAIDTDRLSGFGILPRDLLIPRKTANATLNGVIDPVIEYGGAEQLVIRSVGLDSYSDAVAHFFYTTIGGQGRLYIGVQNAAQLGNDITHFFDPGKSGGLTIGTGDFRIRTTQNNVLSGLIYPITGFPPHAVNWNGTNGFAQEFRWQHESWLDLRMLADGDTNVTHGYIYVQSAVPGVGDLRAPNESVSGSPITWVPLRFGGAASVTTRSVSLFGAVTNTANGQGVSGLNVALYSGDSQNSGVLVATRVTSSSGSFSFSGVTVPSDRAVTVTYEPPGGFARELLAPEFGSTSFVVGPTAIISPLEVRYPPCASNCEYRRVHFRFRQIGPVRLDSVTGSPVVAPVIVRTSPFKETAGGQLTLLGSNFNSGVEVYLKGPLCNLDPPTFCTSDFILAPVESRSDDGSTLTVRVPPIPGAERSPRSMQVVVHNPGWLSTGGNRWTYGPFATVTPPPYPFIHGFEFKNEDDGPSYDEFEACYGNSVFSPFPPFRDPYYGIYFAVYAGWMAAAVGSCSGFASVSRAMEEGTIPVRAFDTAQGDGVRGVVFPNGYLGLDPCEDGDSRRCAPKPSRWTGFDFFQPYRPVNLWSRIVSFQGAQTSAEFLNEFLSQLGRPIPFGARRGFAVGNPVACLNRIRTDPTEYMLSLFERDLGGAHSVTPYAVVDGQRLLDDLVTPTPAAGFSLIKIYDSNHPQAERLVEVDTVQNTFRYQIGVRSDGTRILYEGAGLFTIPMTVFRGARHAPSPFDLARWGIDLARFLIIGATTVSHQDAAGGVVGWAGVNFTNSYEGALAFLPPADAINVTNRRDAMLFLPATNPPAAGFFKSGGSNVLVYTAMGWGDIAFGFESPNTAAIHQLESFGAGPDGLTRLGLRVGAAISGFNAIVASRESNGPSRIFLIDAGEGVIAPDLAIEREGLSSLMIRNRSGQPFGFRLILSGADPSLGRFDHAYEFYLQPPDSTLTLRPPADPGERSLVRELDTNNDGNPDKIERLPANGALRVSWENGQFALRWRRAAQNEVLECTTNLAEAAWSPVAANVGDEGGDRVARVAPNAMAQFYRLRPAASNCVSLSATSPGAKPNPWETSGFKFEAFDGKGVLLPQNSIVSRGNFTGLDVAHTVRVDPTEDWETIHLDVYQTSGLVFVEAVGPPCIVMDRARLVGPGNGAQRVTLRVPGGRINFVRIISPNGLCQILNLCGERTEQPPMGSTIVRCQSFSDVSAGQYDNPFEAGELVVSGYDSGGQPSPIIQIGPDAAGPGNWLHVEPRTEIQLLPPMTSCSQISLKLLTLEPGTAAEAFNAQGKSVASSGSIAPSANPQTVVLSGPDITRLEITTSSSKTQLQDICCQRTLAPQ